MIDIAILRTRLLEVAEQSNRLSPVCTNEESTKLYLVLPLLAALGYDRSDPREIQPEFPADFRGNTQNRVDFAVFMNGVPVIAVECKKIGVPLTDERGQLRAYFNALPPVKLGVLTNGIQFEFFVDSNEPNLMDDEPFLTIDVCAMHEFGIKTEVLDAMYLVTKDYFDPDLIGELAQAEILKKRLRIAAIEELRAPSEEFCRCLLQRVGLKHVRKTSIDRSHRSMIREAFEEALVLRVVEHLRQTGAGVAHARPVAILDGAMDEPHSRISTTDRELAVFGYVRRRLAFLVHDEAHFRAIECIGYRDYVGKFAVYLQRERRGRIFDFIEGRDGYDKYIFPPPFGEIVTNDFLSIDEPLASVFVSRFSEVFGSTRTSAETNVKVFHSI